MKWLLDCVTTIIITLNVITHRALSYQLQLVFILCFFFHLPQSLVPIQVWIIYNFCKKFLPTWLPVWLTNEYNTTLFHLCHKSNSSNYCKPFFIIICSIILRQCVCYCHSCHLLSPILNSTLPPHLILLYVFKCLLNLIFIIIIILILVNLFYYYKVQLCYTVSFIINLHW